MRKPRRTQRALDAGDSAAFSSIFLASGFSCSQTESTPAHQLVPHEEHMGQAADRWVAN
jgi:hypothetical protein